MGWSSARQVGGRASKGKDTGCGSPGYHRGCISEICLYKTRQGELESVRPLGWKAGRKEVSSRTSQLLGSRIKFSVPQAECYLECCHSSPIRVYLTLWLLRVVLGDLSRTSRRAEDLEVLPSSSLVFKRVAGSFQ